MKKINYANEKEKENTSFLTRNMKLVVLFWNCVIVLNSHWCNVVPEAYTEL